MHCSVEFEIGDRLCGIAFVVSPIDVDTWKLI